MCKCSICNCSTPPNELENIHFKETNICRTSCAYLKLLLDNLPNCSTCTYNKHRFSLVFVYTGSAMKYSACNFRQNLNDFQVFCFQKRKLLGAPTHKYFIFLENFAVFFLAVFISVWKIFYFVLPCIYKGNRKTLFLEACRN